MGNCNHFYSKSSKVWKMWQRPARIHDNVIILVDLIIESSQPRLSIKCIYSNVHYFHCALSSSNVCGKGMHVGCHTYRCKVVDHMVYVTG